MGKQHIQILLIMIMTSNTKNKIVSNPHLLINLQGKINPKLFGL